MLTLIIRMSFLARIAFRSSKACARERVTVWIFLVSRVKPYVTHDIYKGFSIRKTHIIETTCNILSYRRDTIMVHTYAYTFARVSCTCVACYVSCLSVCVHIYTYRPNIILTPDAWRRTVKASKTEARVLVSRFRLPVADPSLARTSTKIDCNSESGISPSSRRRLGVDEIGENRE